MDAYPLSWPVGWKRTPPGLRQPGRFATHGRRYSTDNQSSWRTIEDITIAQATQRVIDELGRMGVHARDVIISTNLQLRNDGLPRSGQRAPEDPGAAVYWKKGKRDLVMATDRYTKVEHNLAAIAATIEAMRAIERHGGAEILERSFTGFAQLAAPVAARKPWRDVFGFAPDEEVSKLRLEGAYRTARSEAHPDRPETGSHEKFLAVQDAYREAGRELGFSVEG